MSNFSNIGFNVETEEAFQELLAKAFQLSQPVKISEGSYSVFTDSSGAQLYIQFNDQNECIGANPYFQGKSKRTVCLTATVERTESELDGAFHCWADPSEENYPDSGAYPFVFDLPDFKTIAPIEFPKNLDIQLTAFAHELSMYESEKAYAESQTSELKFAAQSFIPTGLFSSAEESDPGPAQASGFFTGLIKQWEHKKNGMTGEAFSWLLVDTLGGEVDVVADSRYFENEPKINGVIQGEFCLSGRLINAPTNKVATRKSFMQKLFGR